MSDNKDDQKEKALPDYIQLQDDGSAQVTLSRPSEIHGAKVSVLTLREPTVADQMAAIEAKGSDVEKEVRYLANLCEVSPDDLRKLRVRDYLRLQTALLGFTD